MDKITTSSLAMRVAIAAGLIILGSCEEEIEPTCNCDANGNVQFDNEPAIVAKTMIGFLLLSPNKGFIATCIPFEDKYLVDGLMVYVHGRIKATCLDKNTLQTLSYTDIESVELATDTVFKKPPFGITVIRSEDYGYQTGFGYKLFGSSGPRIEQPFMPVVEGYKPFKTATHAFKTAVLVSHRLQLSNGELPTTTLSDLLFLEVLY